MAKKEFLTGLDAIFQGTETDVKLKETKGKESFVSKDNLEVRATFIVNEDTLRQIKAIAYWERCQIKVLIDKSLNSIISSYSDEDLSKILKEYNQNRKSS